MTLVLSHCTFPQPGSSKVPGGRSWVFSPLLTCSTSFSSYFKARTAQNKSQKEANISKRNCAQFHITIVKGKSNAACNESNSCCLLLSLLLGNGKAAENTQLKM